jgi:hypothetical protein
VSTTRLDVVSGGCTDVGVEVVEGVGDVDGANGAVIVAVSFVLVSFVWADVVSTEDETMSFSPPHANPIEHHTTVAGSRQVCRFIAAARPSARR